MSAAWWVCAAVTVAVVVGVEVAHRRFRRGQPDRAAVDALLAVVRSQPLGSVLSDEQSGSRFLVDRFWPKAWTVTRCPAAEFGAAVADVENGDAVSTFPCRRFTVGDRTAFAGDQVIPLRRGDDGKAVWMPLPQVSWWQSLRTLRWHLRTGTFHTTEAELLELAEQLRRARPRGDTDDAHA